MNRVDHRLSGAASLLAALLVPSLLPAQAAQRGFELERLGRTTEAAESYLATVRRQPNNIPALLGLERVLPVLERTAELLPLAQAALAGDPRNDQLRGLVLRTYVVLNHSDSAEAFVTRWARSAPGDEQPYREWGVALQDARRYQDARRAFLLGRRALGGGKGGEGGRPDALAPELADLAERDGAWQEMAREWAAAVTASPALLGTAASRLREAPKQRRTEVVDALGDASQSHAVRRLTAELLLVWGDPERAWQAYAPTIGSTSDSYQEVRRFADAAGALGTPAAKRVRGLALVRLAEIVPAPLATRVRTDAARALLDAGDVETAQGVLEQLARDPNATPEAQALAQTGLIRALISAGRLDSAQHRIDRFERALPVEERAALRIELARARLARGELDHADRAIAADSGLEAVALRGWVALYRGDLGHAAGLFVDAGPFVGGVNEATDRSRMLALLQPFGMTSSPTLGSALMLLAMGDSASAVQRIERAADARELAGGRPEVLLLAGEVAARLGDSSHVAHAIRLFREVTRTGGDSPAVPAAQLQWARLLVSESKTGEAIELLESLILTHPASALIPQARRELERAKGAVPRS
jgi:tetratricopeptide (TPR) repeat protein